METVCSETSRCSPVISVGYGLLRWQIRPFTPSTGVQIPLGTTKISKGYTERCSPFFVGKRFFSTCFRASAIPSGLTQAVLRRIRTTAFSPSGEGKGMTLPPCPAAMVLQCQRAHAKQWRHPLALPPHPHDVILRESLSLAGLTSACSLNPSSVLPVKKAKRETAAQRIQTKPSEKTALFPRNAKSYGWNHKAFQTEKALDHRWKVPQTRVAPLRSPCHRHYKTI